MYPGAHWQKVLRSVELVGQRQVPSVLGFEYAILQLVQVEESEQVWQSLGQTSHDIEAAEGK